MKFFNIIVIKIEVFILIQAEFMLKIIFRFSSLKKILKFFIICIYKLIIISYNKQKLEGERKYEKN